MDLESKILEKFLFVDNRIDNDESNLTPIQEFYKDTKVFITGGTGFLGQILIEKLVRSCPISTIFLMIRPKKGKDANTRLEQMFDDTLFDRMKKACPYFYQKIVPVEGDCLLPELGLSSQDKALLMDEVNIVFHVAATVRFDESLKKATAMNVRATRDLCLLAQKMPRLKSFVHVSTAFSNCVNAVIEERIYPPAMKHEHLIEITNYLDDLLLQNMTKYFLGDYPNTYAYSKQIAEDIVKRETQGVPVGVYRPAIVVSTYKEPIRGWTNNIYGATGVAYGSGLGVLRVLHCNEAEQANMVPVDMCINGLIASAWDVAENYKKTQIDKKESEIVVYNYESTNDKLITWTDYMEMAKKYTIPFASTRCLWVFCLYLVKSYRQYQVMAFFLHLIPGCIADAVLFLRGKKMRLVKSYRKIHTFSQLISYFTVRNFDFRSSNVSKMLGQMTKKDREIFFCDLQELDWDDFLQTYGIGARLYLAKDPIDTIPEGNKYYRRLEWMHKIVVTILRLLALLVLWLTISTVYKLIFT